MSVLRKPSSVNWPPPSRWPCPAPPSRPIRPRRKSSSAPPPVPTATRSLGIKPILEKQGYTVRVVEFNDYVQPNFALAQGALDANAFQHVVYLQNFAAKNKLELSELVKVPTAPIAIYSRKYKSVDAAPEGVSVAVPNDPTNQARALVVLQELGWVKLREGYDPLRVSEKDVAANPKKIKLIRWRRRSCRARWRTPTIPSSTAISRWRPGSS